MMDMMWNALRPLSELSDRGASALRDLWPDPGAGRLDGSRGEGIVSVAIAVLIMAALGVVAYGAFDALFNNTTDAAESRISSIGG